MIGWVVSKLPVPSFALRLFSLVVETGEHGPGDEDDVGSSSSRTRTRDTGAVDGPCSSLDADDVGDDLVGFADVASATPALQRVEEWLVQQLTQSKRASSGYRVLSVVVHKGTWAEASELS